MAQIDFLLKRLLADNEMSYQDDIFELYSHVPNKELQTLFAVYHTQMNHWLTVINSDLRTVYDDDGNLHYAGGYFHAQDSRDFLTLLDSIDKLKTKCHGTYDFKLCDCYDDIIRRCRRFVVNSGGSTIPEGFLPVEIIELSPVFQLKDTISLEHNCQKSYANLKMVGEGSYAQVFSYIDSAYLIPIILKRARHELDNKELERFKQEFSVLKELHSPYIVEVYSYDEERN